MYHPPLFFYAVPHQEGFNHTFDSWHHNILSYHPLLYLNQKRKERVKALKRMIQRWGMSQEVDEFYGEQLHVNWRVLWRSYVCHSSLALVVIQNEWVLWKTRHDFTNPSFMSVPKNEKKERFWGTIRASLPHCKIWKAPSLGLQQGTSSHSKSNNSRS